MTAPWVRVNDKHLFEVGVGDKVFCSVNDSSLAWVLRDRLAEFLPDATAIREECARGNPANVFVVYDKKNTAMYVFDNHDAALRCRQNLKIDHWGLFGCMIWRDWKDGGPSNISAAIRSLTGEAPGWGDRIAAAMRRSLAGEAPGPKELNDER